SCPLWRSVKTHDQIDDRLRFGEPRGRSRHDGRHHPGAEPSPPGSSAAHAAVARGDRERGAGAGGEARRARPRRAEPVAPAADDEGRAAMEQRIGERVRELRTELQADETAVAQEIVRLASRSDISEEVTRFRGHVSHWVTLADSAEPCGRKLDFLLQEMNREVNTMGSKADGLRVSELIIAAKAELEKMREQVQNVE